MTLPTWEFQVAVTILQPSPLGQSPATAFGRRCWDSGCLAVGGSQMKPQKMCASAAQPDSCAVLTVGSDGRVFCFSLDRLSCVLRRRDGVCFSSGLSAAAVSGLSADSYRLRLFWSSSEDAVVSIVLTLKICYLSLIFCLVDTTRYFFKTRCSDVAVCSRFSN